MSFIVFYSENLNSKIKIYVHRSDSIFIRLQYWAVYRRLQRKIDSKLMFFFSNSLDCAAIRSLRRKPSFYDT